MSEETHDWNAILRGAIPSSIAVILIFANLSQSWRWPLALLCMGVAYGMVYTKSKKKADLFTAAAIVFLTALAMHFLSRAGMI
jgi:hypothetical protein